MIRKISFPRCFKPYLTLPSNMFPCQISDAENIYQTPLKFRFTFGSNPKPCQPRFVMPLLPPTVEIQSWSFVSFGAILFWGTGRDKPCRGLVLPGLCVMHVYAIIHMHTAFALRSSADPCTVPVHTTTHLKVLLHILGVHMWRDDQCVSGSQCDLKKSLHRALWCNSSS